MLMVANRKGTDSNTSHWNKWLPIKEALLWIEWTQRERERERERENLLTKG